MRKLLKYLKPHIIFAVLAPLLMVIEVTSELLMPKFMSSIVDIGIANGDNAFIVKRGLIMAITAFAGIFAGIGCTVCAAKASMGFGTDVRAAMLKKIESFSFVNLDKLHTSSLVTRLTNDITQAQQIVLMFLKMLVRSPLLFFGGLIMTYSISPKLTRILFVAALVIIATVYAIVNITFPLFKLVQTNVDNVNTVMRENLSGVRVVKAFVRRVEEIKKFNKANDSLRDTTISAFRIMTLIMPVMMFVMNIVTILVVWNGGKMVYGGELETGDLMAYITYLTQILMSLMMVGMVIMMISRGKASCDRINEVLETEVDINEPTSPKNKITEGKIEFKNVSFRYPQSTGDLVLENINMTINPGETIGILGETGAGKSTFVNLIPRLYDVTDGSVCIDGVDVRDISLQYLRNNIGIVLQKAILFSGTIYDNIRWGKKDATDTEVEQAAKNAQAYDFVSAMPDGFSTQLGQMGVNLSGGQKQRISIARTIIKNPKILIFDDSTSALDTATEAKIQHAMRENLGDVTKIIIAQKITSVMHADKIIMIHDGKISASGTHDELLKSSETYRYLYNTQIMKEGA